MEVTKGKKYFVTGWCLGGLMLAPEEAQHIHAQVDQQQRQQFQQWQAQQGKPNGKESN